MHIFMRWSEIAISDSINVLYQSYPFSCNSFASANRISDNAVISTFNDRAPLQ